MHLDRHQKIAVGLFLFASIYLLTHDGMEQALGQMLLLFILLLCILFYRLIAYFSSFGFPEVLAKDYGSENHPGPYA